MYCTRSWHFEGYRIRTDACLILTDILPRIFFISTFRSALQHKVIFSIRLTGLGDTGRENNRIAGTCRELLLHEKFQARTHRPEADFVESNIIACGLGIYDVGAKAVAV